jgi:hypothetical protein
MPPIYSLLEQWESTEATDEALTDYERGILEGKRQAALEIRALLGQIQETKNKEDDDGPGKTGWEYLYVTFSQEENGVWMVKDVHSGEPFELENASTFSEAIYQLRERGGWRLTNFARGIHVFRRRRSASE